MKILLLGATGYLGSNIVKKLIDEKYEVICVVRKNSVTANLDKTKVQFISNDLWQIELVLKRESIDWIINCVCTYNDSQYEELVESNLIFPLMVMNLGIKYGVINFMTMGTSLPDQFNSYSFVKKKLSEFGEFFCQNGNFNFADLKLEMFYGGMNEPDKRFINHCKHRLMRNEELKLTSGNQKRDIIHVANVVNIAALIINQNNVTGYRVLPVGSGEQHSIREIVEFMKDRIHSRSRITYGAVPDRIKEPDTLADISWYDEIGYRLRAGYFESLEWECVGGGYF